MNSIIIINELFIYLSNYNIKMYLFKNIVIISFN